MNSGLTERIKALAVERNAVILAHNYQPPEIQDVADFTGDSLELSLKAKGTEAEVIVFCGVRFMAETAKTLCPAKTVLLPAPDAGCPMADMVTSDDIRELRGKHPAAAFVCYVNSSAEVKAECDVCCTSGNAVEVVSRLPAGQEVVFVPDENLGAHVQALLKREMLLWPGFCPTHARILPETILRRRAEYPDAQVMVHPECLAETRALADVVLSTGGMLKHARNSGRGQFIVGTEVGLLHRLRQENPGKTFIPATEQARCPNMKRITLEMLLESLETGAGEIALPEDLLLRAAAPLERMFNPTSS